MFKLFYLTVGLTLLYAQAVVVTGNIARDIVRERCETCQRLFSVENVYLDEIETYEGFEGFIDKYDDIKDVQDPQMICLLTDMCPVYNEEHEAESDLNALSELYYDNQSMDQGEHSTHIVDFKMKLKNPVCSACKKVFNWVLEHVKKLADKRPNKGAVRNFFAKACDHLPSLLHGPCNTLIKNKTGKLANMILEKYAAKLACKLAKACLT